MFEGLKTRRKTDRQAGKLIEKEREKEKERERERERE